MGRCNRGTSTPDEAAPYFDTSFNGHELLKLTRQDLQELEALSEEAEGMALWWHLRRREWAEEEGGADGREG